MTFPEVEYLRWAKERPPARINLARSGVELCPPRALGLRGSDLVTTLPVRDGYAPLKRALASRYRVPFDRVFTVSGGAGFATWFACAAALNGCPRGTEVIVERPTYEPLLRIPQALGCRVRRLDRRFSEGYAVDLDRFAGLVTRRTGLAIVSNLHNPSGARIPMATLRRMASLLARVGATLVVDEVYLECLFARRTESCVHAGPNVIATNSLTKAYGLDGLRAGWLLGPARLMREAAKIQDLMANNGVAPGEQMTLAALRHLPAIRRRVHPLLEENLQRVAEYLQRERRLSAFVPEGGNVLFPRLPPDVDGDRLVERLRRRYDTLVVPGRHIRVSFGVAPRVLSRGLANISRALDDLA